MKNSLKMTLIALAISLISCGGDSDGDIEHHVNTTHNNLLAPTTSAATDVHADLFTANWSTVSGATEYDVDVSIDASFSSSFTHKHDIGGNSTLIDGLKGNTMYHYRVKAFQNGSNGSAYSGGTSVLTLSNAPVTVDATDITSNSFNANWEAVPGITTYLLFVSRENFPNNVPNNLPEYNGKEVTGNSVLVEGLESGKFYYYVLKAKNASGLSEESSSKHLQTNY